MFGGKYFGKKYFGNNYFGEGSSNPNTLVILSSRSNKNTIKTIYARPKNISRGKRK